jgi:FdhD protein
MLVSGRTSFELVQKASMAGVPILAAVGAPSSLAVATAERCGMTLIGFLRNGGFNIYNRSGCIQGLENPQ